MAHRSMPDYVALLRGINLGNRRLKMEVLRACFEALKFANVSTFIASGNVIFASKVADALKLESQIERHLEKSLGYNVDTFVRTRAEIAAAAGLQPFPRADMENLAHTVHVGFLKNALAAGHAKTMSAIRSDADAFYVEGREFYWLCRIKSNESKIWSSPEIKALRLPTATMRNLKMLRRLAAEFPARSGG